MCATKAKPTRTLKVLSALTAHLVVVRVTEGRKNDEYTVSSSDGAFWWSHTDNPDRRYRVDCTTEGPRECDCPARGPCRHLLGSITLVARGLIELPAVDELETITDRDAEVESMDAYYAGLDGFQDNGPDRESDDEYADAIGRKILQEPLGC